MRLAGILSKTSFLTTDNHAIPGSRPLKLEIETPATWTVLGTSVPAQVVLHDANDRPVAADHATDVQLTITLPSGKNTSYPLRFAAGQTRQTVNLEAAEEGVIRMEAQQKNRELLGGRGTVYVPPVAKAPIRFVVPRLHIPRLRQALFNTVPGEELLRRVADLSPSLPQLSVQGIDVDALANGVPSGTATVCFTGTNWSHAEPVTVTLSHQSARLMPDPIVIPARQACSPTITVSAVRPGVVQLRIINASIPADFDKDGAKIVFHKPLAGIRLKSPQVMRISLIDSAEVTTAFFDSEKNLTSSGEVRVVNFSKDNASGIFTPHPVKVPDDSAIATTTFYPTAPGTIRINAETMSLPPSEATTIEVSFLNVLFLACLGGAIGAAIGFGLFRDVLLWRVCIGMVTGSFLLWLAVSGLVPQLAQPVVRNTFGAFFISLAGGYIGLPVVNVFAKLLGYTGIGKL